MPNLFPASDGTQGLNTSAPNDGNVKFGRSWRFDFEAGEFVLTPTRRVTAVSDVAAWVEWCKKALHTARYRFMVYSRKYGRDFEDLIGRALSRPAAESEIQRMVRECLLSDPRTAAVGGFSFIWLDDAVYFACVATNALDESAAIDGKAVIS